MPELNTTVVSLISKANVSVVKPVTNVDGYKLPKRILKIISVSCGLIFAFF